MPESRKDAAPLSLPATDSVPTAGRLFYDWGREKSYRQARGPKAAIVTMPTGEKGKVALLHEQARRLGIDPADPGLLARFQNIKSKD
jgi:hypothetical protein